MKPLHLTGIRSALIVAPHSDDEAIGAYGLIRALRHRGARVRIAIVTDGAGSHPTSTRWPRSRLIAERRREALRAMHRIGVPAGRVIFLDQPDGGLRSPCIRLRRLLTRTAARCGALDLLVGPARNDDHPDHRAVATAMPRTRARRLDYLVWPDRRAAPVPATHGLRLGSGAAAKRGAIGRYRTQNGVITDDPAGFAISRRERARFSRAVELFREQRR